VTLYKTGMKQDRWKHDLDREVTTHRGRARSLSAAADWRVVRLGNREFVIEPGPTSGSKIVEIDQTLDPTPISAQTRTLGPAFFAGIDAAPTPPIQASARRP